MGLENKKTTNGKYYGSRLSYWKPHNIESMPQMVFKHNYYCEQNGIKAMKMYSYELSCYMYTHYINS